MLMQCYSHFSSAEIRRLGPRNTNSGSGRNRLTILLRFREEFPRARRTKMQSGLPTAARRGHSNLYAARFANPPPEVAMERLLQRRLLPQFAREER